MFGHRIFKLPMMGLLLCIALSTPTFAQVEDSYFGAPDSSDLSPHVVFPDLGDIPWPLDCSAWPETAPVTPDEGYLASTFGHRDHGGADFHRGTDLRCNVDGNTCCQRPDNSIYCDQKSCVDTNDTELGAPILALFDGTVHAANDGTHNNLVIKTTLPGNDIQVGDNLSCDTIYVWYQHMQSAYAQAWQSNDPTNTTTYNVTQGQVLGWQGKSGANTVHLHLSTRVCENSRADGQSGVLDPEMNSFQLIGDDDGQAPAILSATTHFDNGNLVVTTQIETDAPDFDKLEITVYDAPNNLSHIRRLGYNSRLGIRVAQNALDSYQLDPYPFSEIIALVEPDPPVATSGLTLEATFDNLPLTADSASKVQIKVADVFGNTSIQEMQIFGDAEIGDRAWDDLNGDGIQDTGEPGLPGVGVELHGTVSGLVASATTDAQGNYSFDQLVAGDYYLRFQAPAGYGATVQVVGFPDLDSNVNPQTSETAVFALTASATDLSVDAGFTSTCFDVTLVSYGSEWRTSGSHASGWTGSSFDDSGWTQGQGDFGFKRNSVYTTIPDPDLAAYFRLEFDVEDVTLFDTLDLELYRDDGAIIYLNGIEVLRTNLPTGTVTENTAALSYSEATVTANVPASSLLTGTNVLAVEVHNRALDNDLMFDLQVSSSVCRSCLTEVTLSATAGTYLKEPSSSNYGDKDVIEIDGNPIPYDNDPDTKNGLLTWNLSGLPTDADVLHAEIIVEVADESSSDFRIFAMSRDWLEDEANWTAATDSVNWQTDGADGASDRATTPLGLVSLPNNAPVTGNISLNPAGRALVEDWINGSADNHGLMIRGDAGETNGLDIESGDDGTTAPRLKVVYASACGG